MAKIIMTIDGLGNPTLDVKGAKGATCKTLTKPLEDAFKGGKASVTVKPEMHESEKPTTLKASV